MSDINYQPFNESRVLEEEKILSSDYFIYGCNERKQYEINLLDNFIIKNKEFTNNLLPANPCVKYENFRKNAFAIFLNVFNKEIIEIFFDESKEITLLVVLSTISNYLSKDPLLVKHLKSIPIQLLLLDNIVIRLVQIRSVSNFNKLWLPMKERLLKYIQDEELKQWVELKDKFFNDPENKVVVH